MNQAYSENSLKPEGTEKESIWKKQIMSPGVASIVFGILSLFIFAPLFGILAIVTGVGAWKKGGSEKTKGIIGIILGILAYGLYIAYI